MIGIRPPLLWQLEYRHRGRLLCRTSWCLLLVVMANSGLFAVPSFSRYYPVGANPRDLATADFNGDGLRDYAVACHDPSQPEVTILLGQGDGRFSVSTGPVWTLSYEVEAADFDGDGHADLVVSSGNRRGTTHESEDAVRFFYGNGKGAFPYSSEPIPLPEGFLTWSVTEPRLFITDVNADRRPDIVVLGYIFNQPDPILTLINEGSRRFRRVECTIPDTPRDLIFSAGSADFNEDGLLDLAMLRRGDEIQLAWGQKDGTFTSGGPTIETGGASGEYMLATDLDGDGHADLIASMGSQNRLAIYHGRGDGSFETLPLLVDTGTTPAWIGAGDWNDDGRRDLCVYCRSAT
ncbi:MAG: VCBS repeat-containing protein, partial [Planctomycetes bacterium]|nr:VCBS repeat-containing protein [Planctomycetota bacterium]